MTPAQETKRAQRPPTRAERQLFTIARRAFNHAPERFLWSADGIQVSGDDFIKAVSESEEMKVALVLPVAIDDHLFEVPKALPRALLDTIEFALNASLSHEAKIFREILHSPKAHECCQDMITHYHRLKDACSPEGVLAFSAIRDCILGTRQYALSNIHQMGLPILENLTLRLLRANT